MSDPTQSMARLLSLGTGVVAGLLSYAMFPDQALAIFSGVVAAMIVYMLMRAGGR